MIFSAPIFLYFLPAAGLPVLFHLFLKQKKRRLLFPTLMFFHKTDPKLNSRRKIHQLLLLLMRVLLIAFILLALSRPKFQSSIQMGGKISAVVIVDNSGSMSDIAGDEKTKLKLAVEGAKRLVSLLGDSAGMNIVTLVEDPAVASGDSLSSDTESLLTLLDQITPTDATGSAGDALAKAFKLLTADSGHGGVVHVFSDMQQAEWDDEALQSESAGDSINVILHRIESPTRRQANAAISSIQFPRQKILARHPLKIGVVCTNNSAAVANIRVNSIDNKDKKSTQKVTIEPGRSQIVEVGISPDTPGYHWLKTWIEGDGFAADNQAPTGIICGQTATVLFAGSPSEFGVLPTAFSPDSYGQLTGMISKFTRSAQLPQVQGKKPILIVTTWEQISQNNQASSGLRQYIEAGGNLFLVPSAIRADTNVKLPAWLGAGTKSRLSNARGIKVESMTKESGFWNRIREATGTASPENITVFTYYPLELSEGFTPLLGIDFEKVMFAHRELGRGNIYVSGTAFDPRWNTLPLSGLIVVMAQSIAVEGTALEEEAMISLVAGESPKGINTGGQQVEVTSLAGDETDFKGQAIDMPVFSKSGVYLVKAGGEEFCVSVRSSPKEGLTQFLKGSQVPAMDKIKHSIVDYNPTDDLQKYHAGQSRTFELFLPFIILATLALLAEGWLANPVRAKGEKTTRPKSIQSTGQDKQLDDIVSTSNQEVLISGGGWIMEVLRWRTHLHPILAAAMILILAVWLIVLFRRQRRSRSLKQTVLLLFPKVLIVLLIIFTYFDPVRSVVQRPNRDKKIMVLLDTSSSMDCRDELEISCVERARGLAQNLAGELRSFVDLENLNFDVEVHGIQEAKQAEQQIRGTNLGKCLVTTADKADNANYLSVVLLTDGGDELIQTSKLPNVPLYITGIGSSPDLWNDLAVTEVTAPKLVEQGGNFEVTADILARFASRDFAAKVPAAQVRLEEKQQDQWQVRGSEFIRLDNPRARAKFSLQAPPESGTNEYRITVQNFDGELSTLNNVRNFSVEVRRETLHVLFFAQELGWDFSTIRKELARDPSVELTALFRISEQRFIVQGTRQKGDEQLEAGFPSSKEVLDLFKCIIVGSFGASQWQQNQLTALLEYVRDGGAVVFLGGENSFGRGGYDRTIIEPLFPWRISNARSEFQIGRFAVSVSAAALGNSVIEEATRIISQSDFVSVESLNVEGPLKDGAVTLLEASSEGRYVPLVSMQRYGQGQTMAVATNTLWKWCRTSDELKEAYGCFWQETVKNMTSWEEGQRFLAIKWDQQQYNPGEKASATIRIAGRHDAEQLRLTAEMEVEGKSTPITVEPMMGRENTFKAEMNFARSARYSFKLQALLGEQVLESYEKTIVVGTRLNEGANLEVDHAFLNNLAAQAGGRYFQEAEFENLIGTLKSRIVSRVVSMEIPLIEDKYIYILIFIGILILEWIIRRRMNLL